MSSSSVFSFAFNYLSPFEAIFIAPLCTLIESIDSIEKLLGGKNFVYKNYCLIGVVRCSAVEAKARERESNKSLEFNSPQQNIFSLFISSREQWIG
jgi:hypothetical protein